MKLKMTEYDEIYSEEYAEGTHVCTLLTIFTSLFENWYFSQHTRFWNLSHFSAMKAQTSLCICTDIPEPLLLS